MSPASDILPVLAALAGGPILGGAFAGLDRILTAWCQSRVGPPLLQPFYDVAKLFSKELVVVSLWQVFCAYAYLAASSIALVLFFLQFDLLLILLIQAVGSVFLVVGAFASASPFSQIGAHRELLQMLCYEPLLVLVAVGIRLETGSFLISAVLSGTGPLLLRMPLLFLALGFALTIKLRKSPFDLATSHHAHQELVKGLLTDYSGPCLALVEIGHWFEVVLMLGMVSLFWADSWLGMAALVAAAYFVEILVDNGSARLNWRWMMGWCWALALTLSLLNLVWLLP